MICCTFRIWPLIVILGYPVLTIVTLEFARRLAVRAPLVSGIVRQVAYVLLPTGGVWMILRVLAELPSDDWAVRAAETAFALTGLYLVLRVVQGLLVSLVDEQMRAPKLLLDILRVGLSLVCGSVVVSKIWNVNLGSLLAAMGVGSIALAFALQEFLGNLLFGMALLSAHKFSIGDWIMVDDKAAEVIEMDWRTVTLVTTEGDRVVVANSTLSEEQPQDCGERKREGVGHRAANAWGANPARASTRCGVGSWAYRARPGRTGRSPMLRGRHRRWDHQL